MPDWVILLALCLCAGSVGLAARAWRCRRRAGPEGGGPKGAEWERAREERPGSHELLATTLEHLNQGVCVFDADQRLLAWNSRYAALFQLPPDIVQVGVPAERLLRKVVAGLPEMSEPEAEAYIAQRLMVMRGGEPFRLERTLPDGRIIRAEGNPLPGGGHVTSIADVTAERQAEAELRAAKESLEARVLARTAELTRAKQAADAATASKTRFLAAASHDLLQPLSAARLFTGALKDEVQGQDEPLWLAHSIETSLIAGERLLRSLLDISKLDAGGVTPTLSTFELGVLLEELVHQQAPAAREKGLTLHFAATALMVESDRILLHSAVQNFVSNAIRYTQRGGVLVGARRRRGRAVIEVWDSGPGIPSEQASAVFEEFKRLHPTREGDGVGLGLAIVDRIARLLGAEIGVRSRLGCGSVFWIAVPLGTGTVEGSAPPPPAAAPVEADLSGLSVLCVENDPIINRAVGSLLNRWGCHTRVATTIKAARALADAQRFDLALIDVHLDEGEDGLSLARTWAGALPEMSIVLTSADMSAELRAATAALGFALLPKPVDPEALHRLLAARR